MKIEAKSVARRGNVFSTSGRASWSVDEARRIGTSRLASMDTPQLDADVLLAHVLDWDRTLLFGHGERRLSPAERRQYESGLSRRAAGTPVAYITGVKKWFGLRLFVNEDVLIPRPETEILVECAIEAASAAGLRSLLDVGTGSGAIAVALAIHVPWARVSATDVSRKALDVAARNVAHFHLDDRIRLLESDLLDGVTEEPDIVVANLPYVTADEMPHLSADVKAEPSRALYGGEGGLDIIRRLLCQIADRGWAPIMLLEIDPRQAPEIRSLAQALFPSLQVDMRRDLSGRDRVALLCPASRTVTL